MGAERSGGPDWQALAALKRDFIAEEVARLSAAERMDLGARLLRHARLAAPALALDPRHRAQDLETHARVSAALRSKGAG
jgi:hypothetical protein